MHLPYLSELWVGGWERAAPVLERECSRGAGAASGCICSPFGWSEAVTPQSFADLYGQPGSTAGNNFLLAAVST